MNRFFCLTLALITLSSLGCSEKEQVFVNETQTAETVEESMEGPSFTIEPIQIEGDEIKQNQSTNLYTFKLIANEDIVVEGFRYTFPNAELVNPILFNYTQISDAYIGGTGSRPDGLQNVYHHFSAPVFMREKEEMLCSVLLNHDGMNANSFAQTTLQKVMGFTFKSGDRFVDLETVTPGKNFFSPQQQQ